VRFVVINPILAIAKKMARCQTVYVRQRANSQQQSVCSLLQRVRDIDVVEIFDVGVHKLFANILRQVAEIAIDVFF